MRWTKEEHHSGGRGTRMRWGGGIVALHIAAEHGPSQMSTPWSLERVNVEVSCVAKGSKELRLPTEWSWSGELSWAIQMGANWITQVLKIHELLLTIVREGEPITDTNPDTCHLAGFEERKGASGSQSMPQPADTVKLAQWEPCQTVDLPSCEVTSGCCFKPLSLWEFVMAAIGSEQTAYEGRNIVSVTVSFRMSV